ncbi:MAG: GNAT family N-acetyltransferase [Nocardioidaceae bacterium]|nr:GNAT family N-acetyltransferase [Nocardioidaceae bacterium]
MSDDETMRLRVLTFHELDPRTAYDLWRLRQQVFIIEQQSPYPDLDGRDLEPATRHFLLDVAGELVGCVRLLDDGDALRIGRVVVAAGWRGRGLADRLMRAVMAEVGDRAAVLDAQVGLTNWYAAYGFEISGPEFDEDGVAHRPMARPGAAGMA